MSWLNKNWSAILWGIIVGVIIILWIYYGYINPSTETLSTNSSSVVTDNNSQCQDDLEEANSKITVLEDCLDQMKSNLDHINSESSLNAWGEYNTMGDTLDNIESESASYNYCD